MRKDCPPGTYLVNPRSHADLEAALVHILNLHGITLQPSTFLTRCVVCNGLIIEVLDRKDKKAVFEQYGSPDLSDELEAFRCNKCGQGYWWSEEENTSASRVKDAATHLLRTCIRGGVPVSQHLGTFDDIDVEEEKRIGLEENESKLESSGRSGVDVVLGWLKESQLRHSFKLKSAYALEGVESFDEFHTFTNVTSDFVGALDYIFFEPDQLEQMGRLWIPTKFRQLNVKGVTNGHLLPSDVWPSDHLAIGAQFRTQSKEANQSNVGGGLSSAYVPSNISLLPECDCCERPILSLFQMAELRKRARAKKKIEEKMRALSQVTGVSGFCGNIAS